MALPSLIWIAALLLSLCACQPQRPKIAAASPAPLLPIDEKARFRLATTPELQLYWKGKLLIASDGINYLPDGRFTQPDALKTTRDSDGREIVNLWSKTEGLSYRKEMSVSPKDFELTVEMNLPSYSNDPGKTSVLYAFRVPLSTLGKASYTARTGRAYKTTLQQGTLDPNAPDGPLIADGCRWLSLQTDDGPITFDLNPKGVTSYSDYGPGDLIGHWQVHQKGGYLEFFFGGVASLVGSQSASKVIVFEGTHDDYLSRHLFYDYDYCSEIPITARYLFGGNRRHSPTDHLLGREGWEKPEALSEIQALPGSTFEKALSARGENQLQLSVDRPALYLITLEAVSGEESIGPYTLRVDGEEKVTEAMIASRSRSTLTFAHWIRDGKLTLHWEGHWAVSAVALQAVLHQKEDFLFHRGTWLVDGLYTPTTLTQNRNREPARFKVDLHSEPIAPPVREPKALQPQRPLPLSLPPQEGLDWRYTSFLGGMGQTNFGTFREFDTQERVARRLDELQAQGINAVIVSGLLDRHLFPEQRPIVKDRIAMIVHEAHQRDIRVIDHLDVSLIWNRGEGHRFLVENIDRLQRSHAGNVPTWGLNIIHPDFKRELFADLVTFARETGIDGYMLDEVFFHGETFCFSPATRAQFTRDTGLTLPMHERSRILGNPDSLLWKQWQLWRSEAITDWFADLRRNLETIRPDMVLMRYNTDTGLVSPRVFFKFGGDLIDSARAVDFIGAEIMPRNVMAAYRSVYAYRKLFSGARSVAEGPIFGLIYSTSPEIQFFGWAMLNMTRQVMWSDEAFTREQRPYLGWSGNFNLRHARPVARTALLYSFATRNQDQSTRHAAEALGISEMLTDAHRQHEFLYAEALTPEKLAAYALVIVPNVTCLSDAQLESLDAYARAGGRLLVTGRFATRDEWGVRRPPAPPGSLRAIPPAAFPSVKGQRWGRGHLLSFSTQAGVGNFEEEISVGDRATFTGDATLNAWFHQVMEEAAPMAEEVLRPVEVPSPVLSALYNEKEELFSLHLLQCTHAGIAKGEVVSRDPPSPAFPTLKGTFRFQVATPRPVTEAWASVPGQPQRHEVTFQPTKDGVEVTLPGSYLSPYTIVFLRCPK